MGKKVELSKYIVIYLGSLILKAREKEKEKSRQTVILKAKDELKREAHQSSVLPLNLDPEKAWHSDHKVNSGVLRCILKWGD